MTTERFQKVLEDTCKSMDAVLRHKAKEYARGDRLSNFKKAAAAMSNTPEKACVAFWMKHVISINDLVNDLEAGRPVSMEMWEEKIGDGINYLVLLKGLVTERNSK